MAQFDSATTALVVIDVQVDVVANAHERDARIANMAEAVKRARAGGAPVIWVQHSDDDMAIGSDGWAIVPELVPLPDEKLVAKRYGDSFEETTLAETLAQLGATRLVIAGAQTDACIRSTLHGAFVRGYDTFLLTDAHTTDDLTAWGAPPPDAVITHTNLYWAYQKAPGRTAGTLETGELEFQSA